MKLSNQFILHTTDTETLLVPVGGSEFSGVVRGNKTLGAILECLKEDVTEEEILEAMKARFDASEEILKRDIEEAIGKLNSVNALV
ncbi:MAG: PqqD family protein [Lachnospiraceae bacterium]|nr:PqqD family protein [Lachnospiraceae bacterium]